MSSRGGVLPVQVVRGRFTNALERLCQRPRLRGVVDLMARIIRGARDDTITGLAAEVAFFAVLSIFPALLALASALGFLDQVVGGDVARAAQQRVIDVLNTFLSERASSTIEAVEALFQEGRGGLLTFGFVAALWAASRGTTAVLRALSRVYDVAETRSRLRTRLLGVVLALGSLVVVALMLAMLVLGPLFGLGRLLAGFVGLEQVYGTVWRWTALPVAFVVLVGWAAAMLHAAPHRHVGWKHELIGAGVTAILWLVVSVGFRLYLQLFGGNAIFGVLGGALIVLIWLYLLSAALLIGGEVNAALGMAGSDDDKDDDH